MGIVSIGVPKTPKIKDFDPLEGTAVLFYKMN